MKDRFSKYANQYAQFRPSYPSDLFEFIYKKVHQFDLAWDAGTGNGQAARELSKKFKQVIATDISARQIENAYQASNISYSTHLEKFPLREHSVDLITVAQAAHWFDMELFSQEVKKVLKLNGVIAVWGYGLLSINDETDELITHFYKEIIGPYWDKERKHIDEFYTNLYFPFKEIPTPPFSITTFWTLEELYGYISTWSSVQKYIQQHGHNPVDKLMKVIKNHWVGELQIVNFPLFLRMGGMS